MAKILVIDDDARDRELVGAVLECGVVAELQRGAAP
jgi:hypothetical protein